ncbi:MAG: type II toxin-antitoxin system PemK/MazF family toxin [Acidimicrobiia bacterium]
MVVAQGDVYWADLSVPRGSEAGYRRPVVAVQGDALNRSAIQTVVCIPLTGNLTHASAIGNVLLRASSTGLPRDSVASVPLIFALDRRFLLERVGRLNRRELDLVLNGLDIILER